MAQDALRVSQLVGVFGPGAMLDLPDRSVVVGSLEHWDMRTPGSFTTIEEPRLAELLKQWLGKPDDPRLTGDDPLQLRTPPIVPNGSHGVGPAIDAPIFPEWFVVDRIEADPARRRRLIRFDDLKPPERKDYLDDGRKKHRVSPVRFVCGCTKGHLQDIDWRRILHADRGICREQMWLEDTGTGADPRDTRVVCNCGAALTLEQLFQKGRLGRCRGERPWIGDRDPLGCSENLILLTRSATNTYFPQVATLISLPRAEDELARCIEQYWSILQKATDPPWLKIARDANPALHASLQGFSDADVFARIDAARQTKKSTTIVDPRLAEYALLASGRRLIGENAPNALLHAETLDRNVWDPDHASDLAGIGSLVAVHRLREVSCIYGFTRFEPAMMANDDLEDIGLAVEGAPLGKAPTWLPAIEQFGEGIFPTFASAALARWLAEPALIARAHPRRRCDRMGKSATCSWIGGGPCDPRRADPTGVRHGA